MVKESDWHLVGQERYLQDVTLVHKKYSPYSQDSSWNHDHCEFCWATFMVRDYPDVLHIGYATTDDYHWICESCFKDFKEKFNWIVIESNLQ